MRLLRLLVCWLAAGSLSAAAPQPNIVIILADDLGYGDVGCFGAEKCKTPNLDRMATEGARFTSFYVAQAVCSASRAALMTGCYSNRVGMAGALNHTSHEGINPDEWLLPEMCKERGYATAAFGKWHLGTRPAFHPMRNGFDEFFGIPYSNDNSKYHPSLAAEMPSLPLYEGEKVIETDPDQSQFTRRITEHAVSFIKRNKARPFFLYVPHVMPHVPIFASDKFKGKSGAGLYADVVAELDGSVGEILSAIKTNGIDERTLVIFFSDNGPFLSYGTHAGSNGPLREGKLTAFDGGARVPCIMRWPGKIAAASECDEPVMAIDLLPTITELTGGRAAEKKIDGLSILPLIVGERGARSPHEALFFYAGDELQAMRMGRWKLHFPHAYLTVTEPTRDDGKPAGYGKLKPLSITQSGIEGIASRHGYGVKKMEESLFDLEGDVGETRSVLADHADVAARMRKLADAMRAELGDGLTGVRGKELRPAGRRTDMSIVTKRGDTGETDMLFGCRLPKSHPRIHALGTVDELNAALGTLRVSALRSETKEFVGQIQTWLIALMGELATPPGSEERYKETHPEQIDSAKIEFLDGWVTRLERDGCLDFKGWALPGEAGVISGACADVARTVCRRAERIVVDLEGTAESVPNAEVVRFLNRLSDVLWLIARWEERAA